MTASLVLHLGPHKTATSLIQQVIVAAVDDLVDEGVRYAVTGRQVDGHHALAFALWSPSRRVNLLSEGKLLPAWGDLVAEAEGLPDGTRLVVSSENFAHVRDDEIVDARAVRQLDVELVVGIRDLHALLPSLWQEGVKWGRQWSFDEAVGSLLDEDRVRLLPLIDRWVAATGAERVHGIVVPGSHQDGRLVLEQTAAAIGCRSATLIRHMPDRVVNPSMPWVQTDALRHVCATVDPEPSDATLLLRQRALQPLLVLPPPPTTAARAPWVPDSLESVVADVERSIRSGLAERSALIHADLALAVAPPADRGRPPSDDDIRSVLVSWSEQSSDPVVGDHVQATLARLDRTTHRRRGRLRRLAARLYKSMPLPQSIRSSATSGR